MEFEPAQAHSLLGPLFTEKALSDIPLFGSDRANVNVLVENTMTPSAQMEGFVTKEVEQNLPDAFVKASSLAEKLIALRQSLGDINQGAKGQANPPLGGVPSSQLQRHEKLLGETKAKSDLPNEAHVVLDHMMLLRAKEGYLFNYEKNQKTVADDPWLQDVWAWVAGKSRMSCYPCYSWLTF
jgi:hypothetical protein